MPIRGSSNGARHTRPQARRGGRDRPERVVVIDRNDWSSSIGTGGRHHPVRATDRRCGAHKVIIVIQCAARKRVGDRQICHAISLTRSPSGNSSTPSFKKVSYKTARLRTDKLFFPVSYFEIAPRVTPLFTSISSKVHHSHPCAARNRSPLQSRTKSQPKSCQQSRLQTQSQQRVARVAAPITSQDCNATFRRLRRKSQPAKSASTRRRSKPDFARRRRRNGRKPTHMSQRRSTPKRLP
jgi:hypothetical protein